MIINKDDTLQYTPLSKEAVYHELSIKNCVLHLCGSNIHSIDLPNNNFEGEASMKFVFDLCDFDIGEFYFYFCNVIHKIKC